MDTDRRGCGHHRVLLLRSAVLGLGADGEPSSSRPPGPAAAPAAPLAAPPGTRRRSGTFPPRSFLIILLILLVPLTPWREARGGQKGRETPEGTVGSAPPPSPFGADPRHRDGGHGFPQVVQPFTATHFHPKCHSTVRSERNTCAAHRMKTWAAAIGPCLTEKTHKSARERYRISNLCWAQTFCCLKKTQTDVKSRELCSSGTLLLQCT